MTYPASASQVNQLKIRTLDEASTTSTGSPTCGLIAPFRAKYLYSVANTLNYVSNSVSGGGQLNLAINGSTATADSFVTNPFITISTSTGNGPAGTSLANNIAVLYLNQGDTLTTIGSTMVPFSITHILQEF